MVWFLLTNSLSKKAVVVKAQHDPHSFWFFTGLTTLYFLQSKTFGGMTGDVAYKTWRSLLFVLIWFILEESPFPGSKPLNPELYQIYLSTILKSYPLERLLHRRCTNFLLTSSCFYWKQKISLLLRLLKHNFFRNVSWSH